MRQSMLTDDQARFLREEKESLSEIRLALAGIDVPREALATLQDAILQLDELFLMVVVGEFNAGKSALVNALLGERVLLEGATPTTSRVTLVKWGEKVGEQVVDENFAIYTHPLPLLKELNIVDTPGTNAVIRYHERLTEEFVPRSDLVLFTTSADHPLTESERQFLERILSWGKKVVFALNKADILEDEKSLEEIRSFVLKHAATVLGDTPEFFPVSARKGQRALAETDETKRSQLWAESGLQALEQYITSTLDDTTRLQLKFNNPLGVADNIVTQLGRENQAQSESLKEDLQTATSLEATVKEYERDLQNELQPRLAEVENILHQLESRGLDFFDTTMRITNIGQLMRGDRVRGRVRKTRAGRCAQTDRGAGPAHDRLAGAEGPAGMAAGDDLCPAAPGAPLGTHRRRGTRAARGAPPRADRQDGQDRPGDRRQLRPRQGGERAGQAAWKWPLPRPPRWKSARWDWARWSPRPWSPPAWTSPASWLRAHWPSSVSSSSPTSATRPRRTSGKR